MGSHTSAPLIERLMRAALAVAPGIVATTLGLELLAGMPLLSWLLCMVEGLTTSGMARSPAAVWREVRAEDRAWRRRMAQRRAPLRPGAADAEPRAYADVERDHKDRGDEDPPRYHATLSPPVTPWKRSRRQRMSELAGEDLRRMGYEAIPHREPKIEAWEDGVRLTDEATQDLLRDVFGDEPPYAGRR